MKKAKSQTILSRLRGRVTEFRNNQPCDQQLWQTLIGMYGLNPENRIACRVPVDRLYPDDRDRGRDRPCPDVSYHSNYCDRALGCRASCFGRPCDRPWILRRCYCRETCACPCRWARRRIPQNWASVGSCVGSLGSWARLGPFPSVLAWGPSGRPSSDPLASWSSSWSLSA